MVKLTSKIALYSISTVSIAQLIEGSTSSSSDLVAAYGRCGGIGYQGPTSCVDGFQCVNFNDYYSQCVKGDSSETVRAPVTSKSSDSSNKVAAYDRCGGIGYTGVNDCVDGFHCVYSNDYYSQCVPTSNDKQASEATTAAATVTTYSDTRTTQVNANGDVTTVITTSADTTTPVQEPTSSDSSFPSASSESSTDGSSAKASLKVIEGGFRGEGETTRYWDCCLPSYAWNGKSSKVPDGQTIKACDASGNVFSGYNFQSGCTGGNAYMCNDQTPWVVSENLAYGFAAASVSGSTDETLACSCLKLTFTNTAVLGKEMVVQITNTGGDLSGNHFDLALPGSGFGIFTEGCPKEFGSGYSWGQTYGGISSADECKGLPAALQKGCDFRFNWFQNADNPNVSFEQVVCPAEIIAKSGCSRTDQ